MRSELLPDPVGPTSKLWLNPPMTGCPTNRVSRPGQVECATARPWSGMRRFGNNSGALPSESPGSFGAPIGQASSADASAGERTIPRREGRASARSIARPASSLARRMPIDARLVR